MKIIDNSPHTTGLIYTNPSPHVYSRHAYFPSVAVLPDGELLASFAIGEAFEAANLNTYVSRSADNGETWSEPYPFFSEGKLGEYSNCARIAALPDGEVAAIVVRSHRGSYTGQGFANPENTGFVPTDIFLVRSTDGGMSWQTPQLIKPPLVGPSFELCSPIVALRDGRWIWPTTTWRGWDGYCPNGMKMIAFVSSDQGKTWPEYMEVMNGTDDQTVYWESKILELKSGRLVSVAWAYNERTRKDKENHYTISDDGGRTWSAPTASGIHGQTMAITELSDNRLLAVYRRMDKPGLWCNIVKLTGYKWTNERSFPLWGYTDHARTRQSLNMVHNFSGLKFGAPTVVHLPDGAIYVAFWCYEGLVANIRWFKLTDIS